MFYFLHACLVTEYNLYLFNDSINNYICILSKHFWVFFYVSIIFAGSLSKLSLNFYISYDRFQSVPLPTANRQTINENYYA